MNKEYIKILVSGFMLSTSVLVADPAQTAAAPAMQPAAPTEWQLAEPAKDAKPAVAVLMDKGSGNDNLMVKIASASDQNNVWCVANDGSKDAVYQLTSKGLVKKFDGVFVAAGKGIVTAINDKQEVFELAGGTGDAWSKVEGLKLNRVSRPNHKVGWGLLDAGQGVLSCFMYNDQENKWDIVKNLQGMPAKGIIDLSANEEESVLALTNDGTLLKRDLTRVEMHAKAQTIVETKIKAKKFKKRKKTPKEAKVKGKKKHKKNAAEHGVAATGADDKHAVAGDADHKEATVKSKKKHKKKKHSTVA